ncbi:hypothetical protein CFJ40_23535 [Salmonella enterica]|nr:hypothetical protein [Salmonella enterica]
MKDVTQAGRVLMLFCLLTSGSITLSASAADDMPEVLRYARQYSQTNPESVKRPAGERERGQVVDVGGGARKLARLELIRRQQQAQLKVLEEKLQASEKALKSIKASRTTSLSEEDRIRLQKLPTMTSRIDELSRDLVASTKKQVALEKQVRDLQQEKESLLTASGADRRMWRLAQQKAEAALQMKNDKLSRDLQGAAEKLASLVKQVSALQQEKAMLLAKSNEKTSAQQAAHEKTEVALKTKSDELVSVRRQVETLKAENSVLKKNVQAQSQAVSLVPLKTKSQRLAYAAGVMYSRDVREAQDGNRLLGISLDSAALIAGLNDALSERPLRLAEKDLATAGHDLEKVASEGFRRVTDEQKRLAETWLKTFRKEKGVARDDVGFWYQVTYEGDGDHLKPGDTVDVVVEESLTNGTVVSDMDRAGNSLRQKVREFPPVFAAGLARLKNHGQITLVVPPELAYGDKGYPPDVPPGATMIYRVRVADRIAENELPSSAPEDLDSKDIPVGRRIE